MEQLDTDFKAKLLAWIQELTKRDLWIDIKQTYVSPLEQAKLWKSGHSDSDIDLVIQQLKEQSCYCIAQVVAEAKADIGPFVTNLLPGCDWSNWGYSMHYNLHKTGCNKLLSCHGPEYKIATRWAVKCGLFTGDVLIPRVLKPTTIQYYEETTPVDLWGMKTIDEKLRVWCDENSY